MSQTTTRTFQVTFQGQLTLTPLGPEDGATRITPEGNLRVTPESDTRTIGTGA